MNEPTIVDVYHRIGSLEAKVDQVLGTTNTHAQQVNALDQRISSLEHNRSWLKGGLWVLSGISGLIGVLIGKAINVSH
jgi:hypothetical protein